jgi:hypothetical protein
LKKVNVETLSNEIFKNHLDNLASNMELSIQKINSNRENMDNALYLTEVLSAVNAANFYQTKKFTEELIQKVINDLHDLEDY